MKAHICHITTSHSPHDIRIFQRECCGLVRKGFKVSIVARSNAREIETVDGVHIVPIRYVFGRPGRKFILPKIAVKKAKALNADIYHFHDPELLPWMCLLAKQHQAKVVWDVHELYSATIHEFHIRQFKPLANALGKLCTNMESTWCRPFAGIVAVTDPITKHYQDRGLPCITVRNTIDLSSIPQREQDHTPTRISNGFSLVASGTTNESRCIYELIDAFAMVLKSHPDCRLRLLASFNSVRAEKKIRQYMETKEISENTEISPLIPWEKLMTEELYRHDVGLVLYARSKNNSVGLPNRLFEYWACQLPVIATDTPLLTKIIDRTQGGVTVNSDQPEAIAKAICDYIEKPILAQKHGQNGYQAVIDEFNWEHDLNKLCDLYNKILSSP